MPVENSKPNEHRWWGTLTIDPTTTFVDNTWIPKNASDGYPMCVFIKTTWESHIVASNTGVNKVRVFRDLNQAKAAFDQLTKLNDADRNAIKADLDNIEVPFRWCPIVEVTEFDNKSPLSAALGEKTEQLFNDSAWRNGNYDSPIGKDEIERALKLK